MNDTTKVEKAKNFFGLPGGLGGNVFTYPVHSHDHVIYIDDIEYLEDHQERLQVIRQATPDDTVRIIINSPGGVVSVAMAYVSAIRESSATVVTHAEGNVCSAGTFLWLSCKERTVAPLTEFMFHNYQGGTRGDGANMFSQVNFYKNYFDRLMDRYYSDILTEQELATIKGGGQVWMDEVEILKRCDAVLLDEKNIDRMKNGKPPISSKPQSSKKEAEEYSAGDINGIKLKILFSEDDIAEFNLLTLKASDFDGYNVEELQIILSRVVAVAQGDEEPQEVTDTDRKYLIDTILEYSASIVQIVKDGEEE